MPIRCGQLLILTLAVAAAPLAGGCDMHRWAYVQVSSLPPGATVHSKGLEGSLRLKATKAPAGHFFPCTPIDQKAEVLVPATHWSYVLKTPGYSDEELFVERSAVAARCAESKEEARQKPFTLSGKMMRITSEKGLETAVKITSDPTGVSIYDAGTKELLGKTPKRVIFTFFAPYKVGRVLLFRLPGYQVLQRTVHVRSINLHIQMLRPGERPRPLAPPPKKRKTSPAPEPTRSPPTRPAPTPPGRTRPSTTPPVPRTPRAR